MSPVGCTAEVIKRQFGVGLLPQFALQMDEAQIVQRPGMAPLGSVAIKLHRAGLVLLHAPTLFVELGQLIARFG